MRELRWLTLLGVLGVLGWVINPYFHAFFGFLWFMSFFWYDERTAAVMQAAGFTASVATVFAFVAVFVALGFLVQPAPGGGARVTAPDLVAIMALSFGGVFGLHMLVLGLATIYFDKRGV